MPEMRAYGTVPQAVNQDLQLPDRFPPLPDSIRKRFGSDATDFDAALGQFWTRTRRVLTDTYFDLAAPVNAVKQDTRNIRKEYVTAIGTMTASFQEQINVMVSDTEALATRVQTLEASVISDLSEVLARITTEETVRASQTAALATRTTTIEASITSPTGAGIMARLLTEEVARAGADGALATRTTAIESSITSPTGAGVLARIIIEEGTRATQDTALSTRTTTIESSITSPTGAGVLARLITEEGTRATQDTAISNRTTIVESAINTPTTGILARISTVESTKVDSAGATAAAVSAISAALTGPGGTIFASVDFERSARVTREGWASGNVMLQATAGNVITGIYINSAVGAQGYTGPGVTSSDVTIAAANFKIWNGLTKIQTFAVDGSGNVTVAGSIKLGSSTQVPGLGGFALIGSLAYNSPLLTGTKPPPDADVTLTAVNNTLNVTGGGINLVSGGSAIRSGQTAYDTGIGFWMGEWVPNHLPRFSIGNSAGNKLTYADGVLAVTGNLNATSGTIGGFIISGQNLQTTGGGNAMFYGGTTPAIEFYNASYTTKLSQTGLLIGSNAYGNSVRLGLTDCSIDVPVSMTGVLTLFEIRFWTDVKLWRSGANTLRCDNSFIVGGDFQLLGQVSGNLTASATVSANLMTATSMYVTTGDLHITGASKGVRYNGGNAMSFQWDSGTSRIKCYVDGILCGTIQP